MSEDFQVFGCCAAICLTVVYLVAMLTGATFEFFCGILIPRRILEKLCPLTGNATVTRVLNHQLHSLASFGFLKILMLVLLNFTMSVAKGYICLFNSDVDNCSPILSKAIFFPNIFNKSKMYHFVRISITFKSYYIKNILNKSKFNHFSGFLQLLKRTIFHLNYRKK